MNGFGFLCGAAAAQTVQNAALALQGKAVLRHQVAPHFIHEMAVQVVDAAAPHALQVQVLPAVAALVHILEHGFFALVRHVFHHPLLPGQFIQIAVDRGGVGGRALLFQTDGIPVKTTRSTQGVQVMTLKKSYKAEYALPLAQTKIVNRSRYRARSLPAAGALVKAEDQGDTQMSLL